jgi:hypothetical protein
MMAALMLNAVPAVAFGDLLDLVRARRPVFSGEICDACQTINLGSRRFCKGCEGRLPAYYARAESGTKPTAGMFPKWTVRTVVLAVGWFGGLLLLTLALAAFTVTRDASPVTPEREQAAVTAVAAPAVVQPVPSPVIDTADVPVLATDEDEEIYETEKPGPVRTVQAVTRRPAHLQRSAAVQAAMSTAAKVARCDRMNFFFRAVCVNNECAQPSSAHASSCVAINRQRRLDEARRNPTMVG